MCGIIGYIGNNEALPYLVKGLKRLEYRGYDSSGIAIYNKKNIKCIKAVGKINALEEKLEKNKINGSIGIAHSRWATHGNATLKNAHPHFDCHKDIFIAHNGIIENYKEIRKKLEKKGHQFISQTDTEVIAHLIEHFFEDNLEDAVRSTLKVIKGTYGIIIISKKDPDKIIAARMFSPLIISINKKGSFIASDASAIIDYSKKMIFLEDGDIAIIKKNDLTITDVKEEKKDRKEVNLDWKLEDAQKEGYPHFMLKEIMEQPLSIKNSIRGRIIEKEGSVKLGGLEIVEKKLKKIEKINIIACGTSYYAGMIGKKLLEEISDIETEVDLASEFRYRKKNIKKNEAFLFISQSGETADTLAVLREVKKKGVLTLGVVNNVGSSIARETDAGVYNHAGPEIGVASTKAFTSQITVLSLIAVFLGRQRSLSYEEGLDIINDILSIEDNVKKVLKNHLEIKKISEKYKNFKNFYFLGRNYNYPAALEGALKLKEISYIHAEGYPAGELKHGPLALIDENLATFVICTKDNSYEKTISNIEEVKARRGPVIIIGTEKDKRIKELTKDIIYLKQSSKFVSSLLAVIVMQLFAYYISVALKKDPDKPRNLAKSVTVE